MDVMLWEMPLSDLLGPWDEFGCSLSPVGRDEIVYETVYYASEDEMTCSDSTRLWL